MLVNSQLVASGHLGFLTLLSIICFSDLLGPTSISAINTTDGK